MRFCRMCGNALALAAPAAVPAAPRAPTVCPRCNNPLAAKAVFCGVCGMASSEMVGGAPPASVSSLAHSATVATPATVARVSSIPPPARNELRTDNFGAEPGAPGARLVTILKDGSEGPSYRLPGPTTDIGRSEGNITLPDDPYLSPRHARIAYRGGRYYVRDLSSVNGVYYKLRDATALSHGDLVLAGQQVLRVEILTEAETSLGPVMHYGVTLFGAPEVQRFARLVQLRTDGVPGDIYHLYRDETVIGRETADVVFSDDAFMSRRHAAFRIDRAQRRVSVRDLGSSNGTLVQFRGEREITEGDLFRIGHHLFRFDVGAAGAMSAPHGGSPGR